MGALEYRRKYVATYPEKVKETNKKWRLANKDKLSDAVHKARRKKYYHDHKEHWRAYGRVQNFNHKLKVLTHYGPNGELRCSWPGCQVDDIDMLSLDHKNNDGYAHRRVLTRSIYSVIVRSGEFPDLYQTLCMNHQWKKRLTLVRDKFGALNDALISTMKR